MDAFDDRYKSMKQITFVSSNLQKIKEVSMILGDKFPWELRFYFKNCLFVNLFS